MVRTMSGHAESINGCGFTEDGLVSCGGNRFWGSKENMVMVWSLEDATCRAKADHHTDAIMGLCVSADRVMLATSSMDKTAKVWNLKERPPAEEKEKSDKDRPAGLRASTAVHSRKAVDRARKNSTRTAPGERSVECHLGCGGMIAKSALSQHESVECPQRLVQCRFCAERILSRDLLAHEQRDCPQRVHTCACGAQLQLDQRQPHETQLCPLLKADCTQGCGTQVSARDMPVHLASFCQEREVGCVLGCSSRVKARGILRHQQRECPERQVTCPMCKEAMPAREEATHRRRSCAAVPAVCRLGCGARLLAKELEAHESTACPKRVVPCALGCGERHAASSAAEHEARLCPFRPVPCELCGRPDIPLNQLAAHQFLCQPPAAPSRSGHRPEEPQRRPDTQHLRAPQPCLEDTEARPRPTTQAELKCPSCQSSMRRCPGCQARFCQRCERRGWATSRCAACEVASRTQKPVTRLLLKPMRFGVRD